MKISYGTKLKGAPSGTNGFGYATLGMLNSLDNLGYEVEWNDPSADVEIWFDQPHHWNFSEGPYKIGYLPWESTSLISGWIHIINRCDEIWTPSPMIADWFKRYMHVKPPVYVYEHGIEKLWTPQVRKVEDELKFLHVGAEAARKGGWDTVGLFRKAFPTEKDVSLTLKIINSSWNGVKSLGRVHYVNDRFRLNELIDMFHDHHAYVYPSWGEGFGLTPLQALATGMPTITTTEWAPYKDFIDPDLSISSELKPSPWGKIHPGKMLKPNWDEVVDAMRYTYNNYERLHSEHLSRTEKLLERYDWDTITKSVFEDLEDRLNNR